ncbi:MAG: PilZ domain-containing protein, partial [Rhodanobacteraceae bacterium]
ERLRDDALYQIRFALPTIGNEDAPPIEVGVHEQWTEQAAVPGQFWSGLRIIDISPEADEQLATWLENA